jgi:hypothetical protein
MKTTCVINKVEGDSGAAWKGLFSFNKGSKLKATV